mmetsp:Transcript_65542/g.188984  ORF Transcript_65542/g.188984 Transcript_65542/m.188984 type:complete len:240 (-) Transcript_65542:289-1008(-)
MVADESSRCRLFLRVPSLAKDLLGLLRSPQRLLWLPPRNLYASKLLQHSGLPLGVARCAGQVELFLGNGQRALGQLVLQVDAEDDFQRRTDESDIIFFPRGLQCLFRQAQGVLSLPRSQVRGSGSLQGRDLSSHVADAPAKADRLHRHVDGAFRAVSLREVGAGEALERCRLALLVSKLAAERLRLLRALQRLDGILLAGVGARDAPQDQRLFPVVAKLAVQVQRLLRHLQRPIDLLLG